MHKLHNINKEALLNVLTVLQSQIINSEEIGDFEFKTERHTRDDCRQIAMYKVPTGWNTVSLSIRFKEK